MVIRGAKQTIKVRQGCTLQILNAPWIWLNIPFNVNGFTEYKLHNAESDLRYMYDYIYAKTFCEHKNKLHFIIMRNN